MPISSAIRLGRQQTMKTAECAMPVRSRPCRLQIVCRSEQERSFSKKSINLLVTTATVALLATSPVDAKQVLVQPKLKSIFYEPTTEKKKSSSSQKTPSSSGSEGGFGLNLGYLSLPLTILGCGGLYFAGTKFGNNFDGFMEKAWLKDSEVNGVGYEEEYKATDFSRAQKR